MSDDLQAAKLNRQKLLNDPVPNLEKIPPEIIKKFKEAVIDAAIRDQGPASLSTVSNLMGPSFHARDLGFHKFNELVEYLVEHKICVFIDETHVELGYISVIPPKTPLQLKTKWRMLGDFRRQQGKLAGAAEAYEKVVAMDPKDAKAWKTLGDICVAWKDKIGAERAYKQVTELRPHSLEAWNDLGNIYFERKKIDLTIEAFRRAIEIAPSNTTALVNLGSALVAGKKVVEGLQILDEAAGFGDALARDLALEIRSKRSPSIPKPSGAVKMFPVAHLEQMLKMMREKIARARQFYETQGEFFQSQGLGWDKVAHIPALLEEALVSTLNRARQEVATEAGCVDLNGVPIDFDELNSSVHKVLDKFLAVPPQSQKMGVTLSTSETAAWENPPQAVTVKTKRHRSYGLRDLGHTFGTRRSSSTRSRSSGKNRGNDLYYKIKFFLLIGSAIVQFALIIYFSVNK